MENEPSKKHKKWFLILLGILRLVIGIILLGYAIICLSFFLYDLSTDPADATDLDPISGPEFMLFFFPLIVIGGWLFYTGIKVIKKGSWSSDGQAGADSWPLRGLGLMDLGLLLIGLACSFISGAFLGMPDGSPPHSPTKEIVSNILKVTLLLVQGFALCWWSVKSVKHSRSAPDQTGLDLKLNAQSPLRFFVLSVSSFFFYLIYWFYRNWNDIKQADSSDISPLWRTVLLCVPFVGLLIVYKQLKAIYRLAESREVQPRHSFELISVGYLVPALIGQLVGMYFLFIKWSLQPNLVSDTTYFLLGLVSLVPLLFVQVTINSMWKASLPHLQFRKILSKAEFLWLLMGVLLLAHTILMYL